MKSEIGKHKRVYMIGCGKLEEACEVYDIKPNSKGVDIIKDGKRICSYSKKDMQKFISVGFVKML